MAGFDTRTAYTSSTTLTTGTVTTFYPNSDQEASGFTMAVAELTFAAETLTSIVVPLFTLTGYSAGLRVLPLNIQVDCFKAISQTGTSPTTSVALGVGGSAAGNLTAGNALTVSGGAAAAAVLAAHQHTTFNVLPSSTNISVVRPGVTVNLVITQGGTSPVLTGGARFRINATPIFG